MVCYRTEDETGRLDLEKRKGGKDLQLDYLLFLARVQCSFLKNTSFHI